jgi:hypothetical protein
MSDKQRPHPKIRLGIIPSPAIGAAISTPPVLNANDYTIDYYCPNCGTVLLQRTLAQLLAEWETDPTVTRGEEGQVNKVTIRCTKGGSYNLTGVK